MECPPACFAGCRQGHEAVHGERKDQEDKVINRFSLRRSAAPTPREWVSFALQLLTILLLEYAGDVLRGDLDPPSPAVAIRNAREVAQFEQAHGFFIEPAIQLWFRHAHYVFGVLSFVNVVHVTNFLYAVAQTVVPFLVAIWIYVKFRPHFPLVRNITLLTTFLALVGYEIFPMAPPRLTSGLFYNHHAFRFQDTMQHILGVGKLNGIPIGYDAFGAMPSLHIAWALIVACCLVLLSRHVLVRLLAVVYPVLILLTVVVTANHYLLDAAGASLVVALAIVIALAIEPVHAHLRVAREVFKVPR